MDTLVFLVVYFGLMFICIGFAAILGLFFKIAINNERKRRGMKPLKHIF